jgi:hypothetical protein
LLRFALLLSANAANPVFSPYFINLSSEVNTANLNGVVHEVVINGNTILLVWLEYKYMMSTKFIIVVHWT